MKLKKGKKQQHMNFKVDEDIVEMANVLKDKHYINMSSFFRDSITNLYNKLEGVEQSKLESIDKT